MTTETVRIGVIGGTGLYNMAEITDKTTVSIDTPFGKPSADIVIGTIRGRRVAFVPRHGIGHVLTPTEVPYRANIYALKTLGVRFIISVNACGSLREDYAPGHIVIPTQLVDYTRSERGGRSFFSDGIVAHVSVADPFTGELAQTLYESAAAVSDAVVHYGGRFVIIEGPRFSTRAESHIFRQLHCDTIGMTSAPEAFLATEAEIAYAAITHITDYDVWRDDEEGVTSVMVGQILKRNMTIVTQAVANAVERIDLDATYACHTVLDNALATAPDAIHPQIMERLAPIVARRFNL